MTGKATVERIQRLLELPGKIDRVGKQRVALRAEKRALDRKVAAREALILKELMAFEEYQACRNADERKALFEAAKHGDPNWDGMQERLEQLAAAIEKATHEEGVLDHERKALKAALEREYAEIIQAVLQDKMLANVIMGGRAAA